MPDPRDMLDLSGRPVDPPAGKAAPRQGSGYLRIYFSCANAYVRAQKNAAGDAYTARCPLCGQSNRFLIGSGGTSNRSFVLTCR